MRNLLLFCLAMLLASCSTPTHRTIENPHIEMANSNILDIRHIELTDTATILSFEAFGGPGQPIKLNEKTFLEVDGQRYAIRRIEGGEINKYMQLSQQGMHSFKAIFEPIPLNTRQFDFIEEAKGGCCIWGVDLTGKKKFARYPEGLPKELRGKKKDCPMPEPIFKTGESTLNIHLLGYRPEMGDEVEIFIYELFHSSYDTKIKDEKLDLQTHSLTSKIFLEGTTKLAISIADIHCYVWVAPNEEIDIYMDMRATGSEIMSTRTKKFDVNKMYEFWHSQIPVAYTTGTYSEWNNLYNSIKNEIVRLNPQTNGYYGDYRLSCEQYVDYTKKMHRKLIDSIDRHPSLTPFEKRVSKMYNDLDLVYVAAGYPWIKTRNEFLMTGAVVHPKKYKDCSDEQLREMVKAFDFNDSKYCFFTQEVDKFIAVTTNLPKRLQLSEDNFYYGVRRTTQIKHLLERGQDISPEDKAWLEKANPYFKEVIDAKIEELRRIREAKLAVKSGVLPKTDAEKLFEEIIKPYKGKVVVVDFWNTWCLPCLSAIKKIEPLKSGELSSDDIVWLYLADESSPETAYNERIQNIKGVHFRLSAEQSKVIKRQFGITGIPAYVLVDRDGNYALREELGNIEQMKKILKEEL